MPPTPQTTGVLLMAYGSPTSLDDLEAYYTDIRRGRPPTSELLAELRARYERIGGSPLNAITAAQAVELQRQLDQRGGGFRVYVGMKHWQPRIADAVRQIADDGIIRAVSLVLAPHYSRLSVGDYQTRVRAAVEALGHPLTFDHVDSWHLEPTFVAALARRLYAALARFPASQRRDVSIIFTAHSLPQRILNDGDPYPRQIAETAATVCAAIGVDSWSTAWQSAGRTPEPWLGPDLKDVIAAQAARGRKAFLVCPVGFVADHLEILYDLDVECRALAERLGVALERTESLNASPDFVAALARVVRSKVHRPVVV